MCSIAIPSELVLGHSPPVYGSLLYSSLMVTTPPIANRSVPPQIRPCLASASLHLDGLLKGNDDATNNTNSNANNRRSKKKVVFADDRGRPLTQVRVMSEPSNMPPVWSSAYVANLARGGFFRNLDGSVNVQSDLVSDNMPTNGEAHSPSKDESLNPWEPCFAQPASDYLAFRSKLDKNSVSLENVIIREPENCLIGTVKVKNIAYAKEVGIRVTYDNWKTYEDVPCSYVEQPGLVAQTAVRNLYDTFRFRLPLPTKEKNSRQFEFCVRYTTDGNEYWDSNEGANYAIKKKRDVTLEEQVAELLSACCGPSATHTVFAQNLGSRVDKNNDICPADEATRVRLNTWSEFASWHHLENDAPYW